MTSPPRRSPHAALLVTAVLLLSACASPRAPSSMAPSYPAVPGIGEVDLVWHPREGMRLVHTVTKDIEASGPLTKPVAAKDRKQHISLTRAVEVTAVGPDYFEVRFTQDGFALPATLRISRDWTAVDARVDETAQLDDKERQALEVTVKQVGEPFVQSSRFLGHWKVGETRPFDIELTAMPDTSGRGQGTMTFRGVVLVGNRQAAEFDWQARAEFLFAGDPGRGVPGQMNIVGREWRDLATGASLRVTARADAEFSRQGRPAIVASETAEVLDLEQSRL